MRYVAPTVMCCWLCKSKRLFELQSRRRHITIAVLGLAQPHRQARFELIESQNVGEFSKSEITGRCPSLSSRIESSLLMWRPARRRTSGARCFPSRRHIILGAT